MNIQEIGQEGRTISLTPNQITRDKSWKFGRLVGRPSVSIRVHKCRSYEEVKC